MSAKQSSTRRGKGRPFADDTRIAFQMIEEAEVPVSTTTILERLAEVRSDTGQDAKSRYNGSTPCWRNRVIGVRKSLREAETKGRIQRLGTGPDGSYLWASNALSPVQCATFVANEFLRLRQIPVTLDPEKFEKWAAENSQEED